MHTQRNQALNVLIVDDEKPARDEMTFLLQKVPEITIVDRASSGEQAISMIKKLKPDLIFLDVEMPEINGFQVAERIQEMGPSPGIIFITAYDKYALQAFEIRAVDYILKPIELDRLQRSIEKFRKQSQTNQIHNYSAINKMMMRLNNKEKAPQYLSIIQGDSYKPIPMNKIILIEAHGRTVNVVTEEGKFNYTRSIGEMESLLNREYFFRCHRSSIVNLDYIQKIDLWFNNTFQLVMKNCDSKVSVSRTYIGSFRQIMSII